MLYKKGDTIGGKYEVHGVLGRGGCGVVYLVYWRLGKRVCAVKTISDEIATDQKVEALFRKEAAIWVGLGRHPYIVQAFGIENIGEEIFVVVDYVAPDKRGRNKLADFLKGRQCDARAVLRWGIEFCYAMEHVYANGVECHRDIKPDNIMITSDGHVKVTDFGLANAVGTSSIVRGLSVYRDRVGLTAAEDGICGTPYWMPPEQWEPEGVCDVRSDIYSFGVVLYQMASGTLPFFVPCPRSEGEFNRFMIEMKRLHQETPVPAIHSNFSEIIMKCLCKDKASRFQNFGAIRERLADMLCTKFGEEINMPSPDQMSAIDLFNSGTSLHAIGFVDEANECYDRALAIDPKYANAWCNKGAALDRLGMARQAIECYDKALAIEPNHASALVNKGLALFRLKLVGDAIEWYDKALAIDPKDAKAWNNKGNALHALGRSEEAIECYDKALAIDPKDAKTWYNKGNAALSLGRYEEAISCYDNVLEIDPKDAAAWYNKGMALHALARYQDAVWCFGKALEIDPNDASAWYNKGVALDALGKPGLALECYSRALAIDPNDAKAWYNKGVKMGELERHEQACECFDRAIAIVPEYANAWSNKGSALIALGRYQEAVSCCDKALAIDSNHVIALYNKGFALASLGQYEDAITLYDGVLALDPRHAGAWLYKGNALEAVLRYGEALECYRQFLSLAPSNARALQYVLSRIQVLERKWK